MRLWHRDLIPYLDRQRLLSQHRECCALRGKGWGKKHKTVDYVFTYPYSQLFYYHQEVMNEMKKRGYNVDSLWSEITYRGKILGYDTTNFTSAQENKMYSEHLKLSPYFYECIDLLIEKTAVDPNEVDYKQIKQLFLQGK